MSGKYFHVSVADRAYDCNGCFFGIGMMMMGYSMPKFIIGFIFVFFIAILNNTVGTPKWVMPAGGIF